MGLGGLRSPLRRLFASLLLAAGSLAVHGADYVLALASYHPGFAWTDGQLRGLRVAAHRNALCIRQ